MNFFIPIIMGGDLLIKSKADIMNPTVRIVTHGGVEIIISHFNNQPAVSK